MKIDISCVNIYLWQHFIASWPLFYVYFFFHYITYHWECFHVSWFLPGQLFFNKFVTEWNFDFSWQKLEKKWRVKDWPCKTLSLTTKGLCNNTGAICTMNISKEINLPWVNCFGLSCCKMKYQRNSIKLNEIYAKTKYNMLITCTYSHVVQS